MAPRSSQDLPVPTPDRIKTGASASSAAAEADKLAKKLLELRQAGAELRVELEKGPAGAAWEKFRQDLIAIPGGFAKVNEAQKQFNENLGVKGLLAIKQFGDENERLTQITAAEAAGNRELVAVLEARFALEDKLGRKLSESEAGRIAQLATVRLKIEDARAATRAMWDDVAGMARSGFGELTAALLDFGDTNEDVWERVRRMGLSVINTLLNKLLELAFLNPLLNMIPGQNNPSLWAAFGSTAANAVAGGFSTGSDWGGFFTGRAEGGPVSMNTPYWVGERGPELFMPKSAGTIVPNGAGWQSGGTTYIDARGADPAGLARVEAVLRQQGREIRHMQNGFGPMTQAAMVDAKTRGGQVSKRF